MNPRESRTSRPHPPFRPDDAAPAIRWWHFAVPAAAVLALGCSGFWVCAGRPSGFPAFLEVLYRSLQLFVFEYGDGCDRQTWMLQVARFGAPLVPAVAIVVTLLRGFRAQIRAGRLQKLKGHVVICGLGRKGTQLARDYLANGTDVVAIDLDGASDNVRACAELGAFVLVGNAVDEILLRRARVQHAIRVVAISGDDGINVEIALLAHKIVKSDPARRAHPVEAFVHVIDPKLCALFKQHHVIANDDARFRIRVFNAPERMARALLAEHPLDRGRRGESETRATHLICVGFGKTGEAVVVAAARDSGLLDGLRLRVTVFDLQADARARIFRGRYPDLAGACDLEFVQGNAADADILDRIAAIAGDPSTLATLLVTMNDDSTNLLYALQVRERVAAGSLPICVRMVDVHGLASLTSGAEGGRRADVRIYPFGMASRICARDMLDGC